MYTHIIYRHTHIRTHTYAHIHTQNTHTHTPYDHTWHCNFLGTSIRVFLPPSYTHTYTHTHTPHMTHL